MMTFPTRRASALSQQVLNAWLRNQAFRFHDYTKIFLELR
jgi:hypothetical protein